MTGKRTTTERGYGHEHRTARERALARLRDGDPCGRCGKPMLRAQQLDLDHTDDRAAYRGLAHAHCNRAAGSRKRWASAQRSATPVRHNPSQAW